MIAQNVRTSANVSRLASFHCGYWGVSFVVENFSTGKMTVQVSVNCYHKSHILFQDVPIRGVLHKD
jgi:hypothetical protein